MSAQRTLATVGSWVRAERKLRGMKQGALARELGVSDSTISNWEHGVVEMGVADYDRLRRLFAATPTVAVLAAVRATRAQPLEAMA